MIIITIFGIDVTEQVIARKKLEEEAETIRFITETMPQKVWTGDDKGNIDYMNQQWMDFTGRSFDELKAWGWKSIIHPDDLQENLKRWNDSINTGNDFEFEHRFRDKNGEYRWHLSRARAQKGDRGEVIRWVGTNTDIHDLKLLQTKLQESYEDLETKVKFRNLQLEKEIENLKRKNS